MRGAVIAVAIAIAVISACDGEIHLGVPPATSSAADAAPDTTNQADANGSAARGFGTCTTEPDCALQTLHCERGACVECRDDTDCGGDRSRCDPSAGRCVGCRTDADCSVEKRCEIANHSCIDRCSSSRPCSVGTCEDATGRCVECSPSLPCADRDVCSAGGVCVECTSDADCAAAGEEPYCDALLGRCVRCTSNAHCGELRCDPAAGQCQGP